VLEERIMSEVSLYGICPGTGLGTWPSFLSQNGEDTCRSLAERTWSKQPKTPNSVMIDFRDVLGPTVNELFDRALHLDSPMQLLVIEPKFDGSFSDECDPTLRDGRSFYVATGVLQEMPFVLERLNIDAPPPFLLLGKQLFQLVNCHLCMELTCSQGGAKELDDRLPPGLHQKVAVIVDARHPLVGKPVQPSPRYHCVNM
jgi:hypothetical protein